MDSKIRELTEKIYQEGVEKGNRQAAEIVASAEAKSQEMLTQAQQEAERIVVEAQRKATELRTHTEAELKLYTGQMIQSLKSSIADTLTGAIVSNNVKAIAADPDFMKQIVLKMVSNWTPGEPMVLETNEASGMTDYFVAHAKHLIDEERVEIREVNGKPAHFTLSPKDGAYKVEFGEEQLIAFFKSFLRPALVEALF